MLDGREDASINVWSRDPLASLHPPKFEASYFNEDLIARIHSWPTSSAKTIRLNKAFPPYDHPPMDSQVGRSLPLRGHLRGCLCEDLE